MDTRHPHLLPGLPVFRVTAVEGSAMQGETEKIMYAPLAGLVSYHVDG